MYEYQSLSAESLDACSQPQITVVKESSNRERIHHTTFFFKHDKSMCTFSTIMPQASDQWSDRDILYKTDLEKFDD